MFSGLRITKVEQSIREIVEVFTEILKQWGPTGLGLRANNIPGLRK